MATKTITVPDTLADLPAENLDAILQPVADLIGCILHSDEGPYERATDALFKAIRAAAEGAK